VGGDGSINEVASELMLHRRETILASFPAGSGNGLAMHLGYGRDIDKGSAQTQYRHRAKPSIAANFNGHAVYQPGRHRLRRPGRQIV
jgi:diacylglycerol kinase family enzyme